MIEYRNEILILEENVSNNKIIKGESLFLCSCIRIINFEETELRI